MTARRAPVFTALWACGVLVACQPKTEAEPAAKTEAKPAAAEPEPEQREPDEATPPPEPEAPQAAPMGPSGDPEAVLALLVDGERAAALPLVDSDPDMTFDPRLVEKLAPRVDPFALPPTATVKQAPPQVEGELERDIVRRIVRAHINEIRACYNLGLVQQPALAGKAQVEFEIAATGKVSAASIGESELGDAEVEACLTRSVQRWKFPRPRDSEPVKVSQRFAFSPG